jgi:hypothetical protein
MRQRVSLRTLVLMLELLAAVVGLQIAAAARPAKAGAVWLAGDCRVAAPAPPRGMGDLIDP